MFDILVWTIYGLFVGSIAKGLIRTNEHFGLLKTVALGVIGSYVGGSVLYLLGKYDAVSPSGIIMGVVGSALALVVYNKLSKNVK